MSRVGQFGQISEINDHLFLSGAGVLKPDKIRQKKITCIVNATIEEPNSYLTGIDYLKIRVDDHPYAPLDTYFDLVADKIKANKDRGGRTLVHCMAGVSRSASLCMVYLMKFEKLTLRQAYFFVKSKRPIIHPNVGFWKQMIEYELRLTKYNTVRLLSGSRPDGMDSMPDVYASEMKRHILAASSSSNLRSSSSSPLFTSIYKRRTSAGSGRSSAPSSGIRRSVSPAVTSAWSTARYPSNSIPGGAGSLSALAMVGVGVPASSSKSSSSNGMNRNLFSSIYQSSHDALFPTF